MRQTAPGRYSLTPNDLNGDEPLRATEPDEHGNVIVTTTKERGMAQRTAGRKTKPAAPRRRAATRRPKLKPYKFHVQAVVHVCDGTGKILGERGGETVTLFGVEQLEEWARSFAANLNREAAEAAAAEATQ